jgi:hypothetical protein
MMKSIPGVLLLCAFPIAMGRPAEPKAFRNAQAIVADSQVVITAFKAQRYSDAGHNVLFNEIRIYRRACPDFVFGTDYEEYFSGLDPASTELIFQGKLESDLGSKFRFVDKTAKKGEVYAYWLASVPGEPVGPLPVKVRDADVWWPAEKIAARLEDLKSRYRDEVEIETAGSGTGRRLILGVRAGRGEKCIALVGAVHAGESGPELIIPVLERLLERRRDLLDKVAVVAIPSVNGDVRDRLAHGNPWYLRRNVNLVDLNRNFPADWEQVDLAYGYRTSDPDGLTYRGPFAGSEAETQAVMDFLKEHRPRAVFSFHCLAGICGETLLASRAAAEDKEYADQCLRLAHLYWLGTGSPVPADTRIAYDCSAGSLPAWCYRILGVPAFDMEAPFDREDLDRCRVDRTDIALLEKYREKHFQGFVKLLESLAFGNL